MLKMILVSLFVGVVILVECFVAYTMIPSQAQVEAWAEAKAKEAAAAAHAAHGDEHGHSGGHGEGSAAHEVEVDLGRYNIVVHQPSANLTLRVNFHLIGLVGEKEHHD